MSARRVASRKGQVQCTQLEFNPTRLPTLGRSLGRKKGSLTICPWCSLRAESLQKLMLKLEGRNLQGFITCV